MKKKLFIIFTSTLFTLSVVGCNGTQESQSQVDSSTIPSSSRSESSSFSSDSKSQSQSESSSSSSSLPDPEPQPEKDPVYSEGTLVEKKLKTFNLSKAHTLSDDEMEKIANYDIGERSFYYVENYQYDYYLTLDQYFNILETNAKEGYKFSLSNNKYVFTIDVTDSQNKSISYTTIDIENRVTDYQGYMGTAFNLAVDPDYDTYSIYLDVKYEDEHTIPSAQRFKKDSFKYIDYDFYKKDNEVYFPLSFLTDRFSKEFDINYIFDGNNMYFYDDSAQIKSLFFADDPIGGMVEDNIGDWIRATFKDQDNNMLMPVEMARANRNSFYYAMDNYYGIRSTRGIRSYAEYYESLSWSDKFLAARGKDRGYAYASAINILDDQHTALGLSAVGLSIWEEREGFADAIASKLKTERNALNTALTNQRLKAFGLEDAKQLRTLEKYSTDGKTAYVYLNEFAHTSDAAKKENGQIVSRKSEEELAKDESYYHLLHRIKQIEAHGGVENIVIDMSTNGGGTLGVLNKIASLFSKYNGFETYTKNDKTGDVDTCKTYIDTNYDGKFDDTDVYGNKFKFYLLTSPCSFSCGNALPFYCGIAKTATIIGQRSGGGECSVTTSDIGSLRKFQHSSNTHIVSYKTEMVNGQEVKTEVSAEGGADVSGFYDFSYDNFYDFQFIADLIKQNQERESN